MMTLKATMDFARPALIVLDVVQDDKYSHELELQMTADGEIYEPSQSLGPGTDLTAGVNYVKPDGTRGSYTKMPNEDWAVAINPGGILVAKLAPQMFTAAGKVRFNIWIMSGDEVKIVTFPMILQVHPDAVPDGVPSTDYYNLHTLVDIQTMVEELEDTVEGLEDTVAGHTTDITNLRGATVSNASAIAAIQQQMSGIVKSVNGKSADAQGRVTVVADDIGYTPHVPAVYGAQPTDLDDACGAFEQFFAASKVVLYNDQTHPLPSSASDTLDVNITMMNTPFLHTGDLVIDVATCVIAIVVGTSGSLVRVQGTGIILGAATRGASKGWPTVDKQEEKEGADSK